jgi:hypothetical protein
MSLEQHDLDRLREAYPFASTRALQTLPAGSLGDSGKVSAHFALWKEAEACAQMLFTRTLRLASIHGPKLPGDGGSSFEEHGEGFASKYLASVARTAARDGALTDRTIYENLVTALQDLREFEQLIGTASGPDNPNLRIA